MPQITLTIPDFSITSTFYTYNVYGSVSYGNIKPGTKTFPFATSQIPAGSVINSALLSANWGGSMYGGTVKQAGSTSKTNVDVTSLVTAGVDTQIEYYFKTNTGGTTEGSHSSVLSFTGCQMVVDYTLPFSACAAPSAASLSAPLSEGNVDLSYSGAAGGTNNAITGLEVQYAESDDNYNWTGWAGYTTVSTGSGSGSFAVAPSSTRGRYRKFQLRTLGAAGADWYSGWVAVPGSVRRNSAPAAPGITAPVDWGVTYNSQPRILATVGSDADGHSQTLACSGYAASSAGAQAIGKKIVLRRSGATAVGAQSVSVSSTDALGVASGATARGLSYVVPSWTDPSLVAGTTLLKAVHMTELQAAINNVRAYYGLAAYGFTAITAGVTGVAGWTSHVAQLRAAIDEVVALVNGWDTANGTNDISLPAWIGISENRPAAAVIQQLRDAIPLL